MDLATGQLVEEGMAVGIIAAQSIGEPGTQLTMRTFHIGGTVNTSVEDSDIKSQKAGIIKYTHLRYVENEAGEKIVLTRNSEVAILDSKRREVEKHAVPAGAILRVSEDDKVKAGKILCEWDPHSIPIIAEVGGKVRYEDVVEGETLRLEKDAGGSLRKMIMEHKGELHPQIVLEDSDGRPQDVYYLPEAAHIEVEEGDSIKAGAILAKTPREASGVTDITGGLPRVTEIFEARKPKDPSVIAEIDGVVEILGEKKRGKRSIIVRNEETGVEREHLVPPGKRFFVHSGDIVTAGKELVDGPLVPHDILRVSGEEEVQRYLLREIQQVYRSQRVEINDKHIEIIVARMLRKIKIETAGDTNLLAGMVVDKFDFRKANDAVSKCLKIKSSGDSGFEEGSIVPKDVFQETNDQLEAEGKTAAKGTKPKPATASTQLLGITKAAVQSSSFISAASFQETTKVLTEAALSSKVDRLVGLKENVILGHLIPAGTGFRKFQESEVRYQPDALQAISEEAETVVTQFPLLQAGAEILDQAETPAPSLESLLGSGEAEAPSTDNPEE
jgi:DNA-directed RNA polymerase subunit beta'